MYGNQGKIKKMNVAMIFENLRLKPAKMGVANEKKCVAVVGCEVKVNLGCGVVWCGIN